MTGRLLFAGALLVLATGKKHNYKYTKRATLSQRMLQSID